MEVLNKDFITKGRLLVDDEFSRSIGRSRRSMLNLTSVHISKF